MYIWIIISLLCPCLSLASIDVQVPVSEKSLQKETYSAAFTAAIDKYTHQGSLGIDMPSPKSISEMLESFYFTTDEDNHIQCHLSFNTQDFQKLLSQHSLTYWPETRPKPVLMLDENTEKPSSQWIQNLSDTFGITLTQALMDMSDIQAHHDLLSRAETSALDALMAKYDSPMILTLDTSKMPAVWLIYHQNTFHEYESTIHTMDEAAHHMRTLLAAHDQAALNYPQSQLQLEIWGVESPQDQSNMLRALQQIFPNSQAHITSMSAHHVVVHMSQSGGIDALITELSNHSLFTPHPSPPRHHSTDIAYDYHIPSART